VTVPHPAKFNDALIDEIAVLLPDWVYRVLDPFAGVGKIHNLRAIRDVETVGVELEPEWADQHDRTRVGNALALDFFDDSFDAIVTSPCYGNRMADHHDARDDSKRHTYKHYLGRDLSEDSAAVLQWGGGYKQFHRHAWKEARRVLRPDGLVVINVKNHIRYGDEQRVVEFHLKTWMSLGMIVEEVRAVETPGQRHGENGDLRVATEKLIVGRMA
jgi:tRNA G10  N-methylase Trm11